MKPDSQPASLKLRLMAIALCLTSSCFTIGLFYAVPLVARMDQSWLRQVGDSVPAAPAPKN